MRYGETTCDLNINTTHHICFWSFWPSSYSKSFLRYALWVLPADHSRRATPRADESPLTTALLIGAGLLLLYALAVGIGLLGGDITPAAAYGWMMPIPIVLAACYGYGFARESDARLRDNGLLVSALGWLACALCLLTLQGAARTALAGGLRLDQMTPTPLSWFFAILSVAALVAGGLLSLRHWQRETI